MAPKAKEEKQEDASRKRPPVAISRVRSHEEKSDREQADSNCQHATEQQESENCVEHVK